MSYDYTKMLEYLEDPRTDPVFEKQLEFDKLVTEAHITTMLDIHKLSQDDFQYVCFNLSMDQRREFLKNHPIP